MAKMGRPPIPIDWKKVDVCCSYKMSLEDVASFNGISPTVLEDAIRKIYNETFRDYRSKKMTVTKARLANKAIEMAEKGSIPMLIFCLKNFNKWSDNPSQGFTPVDD